MKTCKNCGAVMRITADDCCERSWKCEKWFTLGPQSCLTLELMPPNVILDVATIADDMVRLPYLTLSELQREQTAYRRIANSLIKLPSGHKYLSSKEHEAINQAISIIEKLGDAAEKAKRMKKRSEK